MFSKIRQSVLGHEISELVQLDLAMVEREIGVESVASIEAITTINQYLQAGGGKRLRPVLLLLTTRLFGPATDTARRLAAVVEMIHTATLVHDDVIDVARTRRGRPSINVVWGNHTSVLAGDWLYMQAFQLALRERNFHILDTLISLTQMMVEGELLQLDRLRRLDISEADYMETGGSKDSLPVFSVCAAWSGGGGRRTMRWRRSSVISPGTSAWRFSLWTIFSTSLPRENTRQTRRQRSAGRQGHAADDLRA